MLTVKEIHKTFENDGETLKVLNGIDFELLPSEFVSILGPSGCGKTTLLKIMSGLETPDSGEITSRSKNLKLPIIWQEHRLFPWRTVEQNIVFGREMCGSQSLVSEEKVKEYIKLTKLNGFEKYYPFQLSGGMQQRVAIARALAIEPDVLLMDEPFSSVDYQTKMVLFGELKKLQKMTKLPVLYVTHDTRDAISFADRVIVLSPRPSKVLEVLDTKGIKTFSMPLEKRIWSLLQTN